MNGSPSPFSPIARQSTTERGCAPTQQPKGAVILEPSLILVGGVVAAVFVLTSVIITTFLRSVDAGEILIASRGRNLHIYRGPCKALIVPIITQTRFIPAQAINVDIEITDQTADVDNNGRSAPVKVTV